MINTIELLLKHINTYDIKYYIHNPEIGRFKNYHFLTDELQDYSPDVLYVLSPDTYQNHPALLKKENVNYLIFDMHYAQYDAIVSPSSNVIIVIHYDNNIISQIHTAVSTCCSAIRRYDKAIYKILNASLNTEHSIQNLLEICSDTLRQSFVHY